MMITVKMVEMMIVVTLTAIPAHATRTLSRNHTSNFEPPSLSQGGGAYLRLSTLQMNDIRAFNNTARSGAVFSLIRRCDLVIDTFLAFDNTGAYSS